jgi:hypothetical protein
VITGTSIPLSDGPRAKVDDVDQGVGVAGGSMQTLAARCAMQTVPARPVERDGLKLRKDAEDDPRLARQGRARGPRAKVDDVDQGVGVAGGLMQTLRARGATGNSGGFLRQVMTEGRS